MLTARGAGTLMPAGAPRLLGLPGQVLTPLNAGTPDSAVARVREQCDLGAADVMGSVAPGQHADLVLLGANPVESVDHLHRISGVVRGGRYYPKAELDALREKAAAGRSVR